MNILSRFLNLPGEGFVEKSLYGLSRLCQKELDRRHCREEKRLEDIAMSQPFETHDIYQNLTCVTGFGHSGSGAVADLLSEYDEVTVMSLPDKNGSLRGASADAKEFDFVRTIGGLFQLEKAIGDPTFWFQDFAVKLFCCNFQSRYNPRSKMYGIRFKEAAKTFLNSIVEYDLKTWDGYEYYPHLRGIGKEGILTLFGQESPMRLFHLKNMSVESYRQVAQKFIRAILSSAPSKKHLVLDQAVSDETADIAKYQDYFGPLKVVSVYRDQRDVYATGILLRENWIPHDPHVFALWYGDRLRRYTRLSCANLFMIRFEDLVCDYDTMVGKIEKFIGLRRHSRRFEAFDPKVSIKNIGIYKKADKKAIEIIARDLREFCVDKS